MRKFLHLTLICLPILSLWSAPSRAWSPEAHELVCRIAAAKLSPDAQQLVNDIMAFGPLTGDVRSDAGFPSLCRWADVVRTTTHQDSYEMHFIDVPRSSSRLSLARDCAAMDCIVVGIQRSLVYLSRPVNGNHEAARRAAALRYLGHLVGDLHQPLHVGNLEDRGGNDIEVLWQGEKMSLHALWDLQLPLSAELYDEGQAAVLATQFIEQGAGQGDRKGVKKGNRDQDRNVLNWMTESFNLARSIAYRNTADRPVLQGETIDEAYVKRAIPVVRRRIQLAGHRLAYLLNELAAGKLDTNILIN